MDICWLCGVNEADSSEHIIKAGVVKELMFFDKEVLPTIKRWESKLSNGVLERKMVKSPLQSHNSIYLKPIKNLCKFCNNQATQPFDLAYQKFFTYLFRNQFKIERKKQIDFKKAGVNELNVFKYFIKFFCCMLDSSRIVEDNPTLKVPHDLVSCLRGHEYNKKSLIIQFCSTGKPRSYPLQKINYITDPILIQFEDDSFCFVFSESYGWLQIFYLYQSFGKEYSKNLHIDFPNHWAGSSKKIFLNK